MTTNEANRVRPAAAGRSRSCRAAGFGRAVAVVWYRDLLHFWRDGAQIVGSLAQPLLFLVVFEAGLGSSIGGAFSPGEGGGPAG